MSKRSKYTKEEKDTIMTRGIRTTFYTSLYQIFDISRSSYYKWLNRTEIQEIDIYEEIGNKFIISKKMLKIYSLEMA